MDQVVYVHGVVSQDPPPNHRADYAALRDGLTAAGVQLPPLDRSVLVEWGYPHPSAGDHAGPGADPVPLGGHRLLRLGEGQGACPPGRVGSGDSLLDAHKDYWAAQAVHQALAVRWDAVDP